MGELDARTHSGVHSIVSNFDIILRDVEGIWSLDFSAPSAEVFFCSPCFVSEAASELSDPFRSSLLTNNF